MKPFRAGRVLNAYTPNIPWRPQVGHAQPRARVAPTPIQTAVDRSRQEATRASRFRKNSWSAPDRCQQATYREEIAYPRPAVGFFTGGLGGMTMLLKARSSPA